MSGAAKMRHTEVTIKQGGEITKFKFSAEAGRGLLSFLNGLQSAANEGVIPAEEAFPDIKDPIKRVGIIFRGIRFKHSLTQAEVAKRLGLEQSDVSKIEKGKRPVGKVLAKKIEKEFGIDYRRLL
jgi:DNA-binding XRE family transcriptional regulator